MQTFKRILVKRTEKRFSYFVLTVVHYVSFYVHFTAPPPLSDLSLQVTWVIIGAAMDWKQLSSCNRSCERHVPA